MWSSPAYETRDKIIPYRLFCYLSNASSTVQAYARVDMARAVSAGIGLALGGKEFRDSQAFMDELRIALPDAEDIKSA